MKELKEKIPTKVSELGLYFKDFGNGFVRFDGDLLKAVYIVGKINKIIEKTNFKYKNLYKGTEQSVTLKFEYINNNFGMSKLDDKDTNLIKKISTLIKGYYNQNEVLTTKQKIDIL